MTKAKKIAVTQEELREIFDYNEDTGVFTRKVRTAKCNQIGDTVGCINNRGYCVIRYNTRLYQAHRLAWLYVYGEIPTDKQIDHVDTDRSNNKITNLRLCTNAQNLKNTPAHKDNTSGFKGVSYVKATGKWKAQIQNPMTGKFEQTYGFLSPQEASEFYKAKAQMYHGEFYNNITGTSINE